MASRQALYTNAPQPYGDIFVMRYDGTRGLTTHRRPMEKEDRPAKPVLLVQNNHRSLVCPSAKITTSPARSR